jgi:H+/gluconate symporter-like permease
MDIFIILLALGLLMYTAYKGHSVIIFAPLCALLAVAFIAPSQILPFYSNIFMVKMSLSKITSQYFYWEQFLGN